MALVEAKRRCIINLNVLEIILNITFNFSLTWKQIKSLLQHFCVLVSDSSRYGWDKAVIREAQDQ